MHFTHWNKKSFVFETFFAKSLIFSGFSQCKKIFSAFAKSIFSAPKTRAQNSSMTCFSFFSTCSNKFLTRFSTTFLPIFPPPKNSFLSLLFPFRSIRNLRAQFEHGNFYQSVFSRSVPGILCSWVSYIFLRCLLYIY